MTAKENAIVAGDLPGEGLAKCTGSSQRGLFPSQDRVWEMHFQNPFQPTPGALQTPALSLWRGERR